MLNSTSAALRHYGQHWGEFPYVVHLEAVHRVSELINASLGEPLDALVLMDAAYMHDAVEDTATSLDEIPETVRKSVALVSRNVSQGDLTYHQYIKMISESDNLLAIVIKLSDAITNFTLSTITGSDLSKRYVRSTATLSTSLYGKEIDATLLDAAMREVEELIS